MGSVTKMDFFTPCWKSESPSVLRTVMTLLTRLWVVLALCLMTPVLWAQSVTPELAALQIERNDDGIYLSTSVRFDLPQVVEDALQKGIPMVFLVEADLVRERWYWIDRKTSHASRNLRLAFQPLTRRWRLSVGPAANDNTGLGLTLGQYFDSLSDALSALQRMSRWKIADANELEPDANYSVEFRFRLDLGQLPRPFQIGAVGQSEWTIAVSRRQRLGTELHK